MSSVSVLTASGSFIPDADGDGSVDSVDNCPNIANSNQLDTDQDGKGDACDNDDDGDGVIDAFDAFPLDANETKDTDGDGIGNNADTDDDGDGVPDGEDAFPLDPKRSTGCTNALKLNANDYVAGGVINDTASPSLYSPVTRSPP